MRSKRKTKQDKLVELDDDPDFMGPGDDSDGNDFGIDTNDSGAMQNYYGGYADTSRITKRYHTPDQYDGQRLEEQIAHLQDTKAEYSRFYDSIAALKGLKDVELEDFSLKQAEAETTANKRPTAQVLENNIITVTPPPVKRHGSSAVIATQNEPTPREPSTPSRGSHRHSQNVFGSPSVSTSQRRVSGGDHSALRRVQSSQMQSKAFVFASHTTIPSTPLYLQGRSLVGISWSRRRSATKTSPAQRHSKTPQLNLPDGFGMSWYPKDPYKSNSRVVAFADDICKGHENPVGDHPVLPTAAIQYSNAGYLVHAIEHTHLPPLIEFSKQIVLVNTNPRIPRRVHPGESGLVFLQIRDVDFPNLPIANRTNKPQSKHLTSFALSPQYVVEKGRSCRHARSAAAPTAFWALTTWSGLEQGTTARKRKITSSAEESTLRKVAVMAWPRPTVSSGEQGRLLSDAVRNQWSRVAVQAFIRAGATTAVNPDNINTENMLVPQLLEAAKRTTRMPRSALRQRLTTEPSPASDSDDASSSREEPWSIWC
ncbi:hypothetical protein CONLIGDRAFT_648163 [Coniochaeta ligniaria NRRL 30616]|uniref:Uncharacterized protein n=1 Tax=Coniochaeta ligniaria NRRL 30616 TaxID=1408157 RepID=A0A1J7J7F9_9PEZI|nr:hypothetical protein CONLIGDRAFT_648163 [Coniochaeta ligniaria NRRL 30616]